MPRAKDEGDNRAGRLRLLRFPSPTPVERKLTGRNIYARDVGNPSGAHKLHRLSDQTLNWAARWLPLKPLPKVPIRLLAATLLERNNSRKKDNLRLTRQLL